MITDDTLKLIMSNLHDDKRAALLPSLQTAMSESQVNTPQREAAFLAQDGADTRKRRVSSSELFSFRRRAEGADNGGVVTTKSNQE